MKISKKSKNIYSWIWVVLYSIIIFLTVPVARAIQRFVTKTLGNNAFIYFVLSVIGLGFLFILYFLIFRLKIRSPSRYVWLVIIAGLYFYFTLKLSKAPSEAIHFLEYGLLGFLLFRALKHQIKDISIYLIATLISTLIGTFDETIQWITPNRIWSFSDVWLNTLSAGLFLLGLLTVVKPVEISKRLTFKSIKIFSFTLIICMLILGLCASNTPNRVENYTNLVPRLFFLQEEESMSEYGYTIKDPDIGVFYSRLNKKELEDEDKTKGTEYAQILNHEIKMNYYQFLRKYNTITNPFLHEFRIHVFRRDVNYNNARRTARTKEKKEYFFIAYKENLILKKYFGNTLKNSSCLWDRGKMNIAEALIDKTQSYRSPVSAHLFTSFTERSVWIFNISLVFLIVIVNLILYYREKQLKK